MPKSTETIWILEDDADLALSCSLALQTANLPKPLLLHTLEQAKKQIIQAKKNYSFPDLVILDLILNGKPAKPILPNLLQNFPNLKIIVITANLEPSTALECKNAGAFDFLTKPLDLERLVSSTQQALTSPKKSKSPAISLHPAFHSFLTSDPHTLNLLQYAQTIASSPHPVLITGENGTGKELLARAIHNAAKPTLPWVAINVAGLDDNSFSDTLFGHVKGAFTGALQPRQGLLESAANGTLLLDEIGDLRQESQLKLLRLLQEKEYLPLGADCPKRSNARIIATTNRDLPAAIANGSFRADLFYRLNYHHLEIPPLRNRKNDIPLLCYHFLSLAAKTSSSPPATLPPDSLELLLNYSFPGNIRELQALLFDAQIRFPGKAIPADYFHSRLIHHSPSSSSPPQTNSHLLNPFSSLSILPTLSQAKEFLIQEALQRSAGNISAAARMLGTSPQNLWKFLQKPPNHPPTP